MSDPNSSAFPPGQVIYQIYPRSFKDTNGDGIGDLPGITEKLDYIAELGATDIWLSPIYPSPMVDFGYDVADYTDIDPVFGTLEDFDRLMAEAGKRKLRMVLDLVGNHTSDQHPWFLDSRSSRDSDKRDWYVWRDPLPDGSAPNNWLSVFGGSAWEFDNATGQYYLHSFATQQPDLNWRNGEVREAIKDVMRFWLDKGVAGFRLDAINWIAKDPLFRDDKPNPTYDLPYKQLYGSLLHVNSQGKPELLDYLNELAAVLESYGDRFMITESHFDQENALEGYFEFYQRVDSRVAAPFSFPPLYLPWNAASYREFFDAFEAGLHVSGTPIYVTGNHDQPRLADRIGQDALRASAVLFLSLPGTMVVYYGEEIGMQNGTIPAEAIHDELERQGVPERTQGRDPARTPMQWTPGPHAGFTTGKPWLPIGQEYEATNVEVETNDPQSLLSLYKQLLAFRTSSQVIAKGSYQPLKLDSDNLFGYVREYNGEKIGVIVNFSREHTMHCEIQGELLISTHNAKTADEPLRPLEGRLVKILPA